MGGVNCLWSIKGLTTQELSTLLQILQKYLDFNSPRWLTAEAEKKLTLVKQRLQDAY